MIQTVLGPVEAGALGVVSMHEHLLTDASALQRPGVEALDPDAPVTAELAAALRWSQLALADNLRLDDVELLADELRVGASRRAHPATVDLSSLGFGPDHARLPAPVRPGGRPRSSPATAPTSRGCCPSGTSRSTSTARTELFHPGAGGGDPRHRPTARGLLGLMGTTGAFATPRAKQERISLTAAARAAAATGSAITVRLAADARNGVEVLAHVVAEGVDPSRVVFSTVDEFLDLPYLRDLGRAGAVLELCFGNEGAHVGRIRDASDPQRLDALLELLAAPTPASAGCSATAPGRRASCAASAGTASTTSARASCRGSAQLGVADDVLRRMSVERAGAAARPAVTDRP